MQVTAIKTHKITQEDNDIFAVLDKYLPKLEENSVVAISSKIVAICEGRVVPLEKVVKVGEVEKVVKVEKGELVEQEAELYLPASENKYGFSIAVKGNMFVASAGVDESNGNGYYVLWPKDPQTSVNAIREHLVKKHGLKNLGVVLTDSKTTPLRWGVTGIAVSHSGFAALEDYIGIPDVFGRPMHVTKTNVMDSLAASAVFVMGEGSEQTPLAIINDLPAVKFQDRNPTQKELDSLVISLDEDLYAPILKKVEWKKGKS